MNVIIIPAYLPDQKLNILVDELIALNFHQIVIVDDGSNEDYLPLFNGLEKLGCVILRHPVNKGKGAAIKTGIKYASTHYEFINGFITCDADGQHTSQDIQNVSLGLDLNPESLVLGSRDLKNKLVPFKSRFGNAFSSFYFKASTGMTCLDTQTGLRGIPVSLTEEALRIPENRYDYEMNFLMSVAKAGTTITHIPISTVYINSNSSSHFKPFLDSVRIYKEPIKFGLSSLMSALVDLGLFTILTMILNDNLFRMVLIATLVARLVSGIFNFLINRIWSFRNFSSIKRQFRRYASLYVVQLVLSFTFVYLLSFIPIHLTIIKIIVDSLLFIGSYFIQKHWVFKKHKKHTTSKL